MTDKRDSPACSVVASWYFDGLTLHLGVDCTVMYWFLIIQINLKSTEMRHHIKLLTSIGERMEYIELGLLERFCCLTVL